MDVGVAYKPKAYEAQWRDRQVGDGYSPSAVLTNASTVFYDRANLQQSVVNAQLDELAMNLSGEFARKKSGYHPAQSYDSSSFATFSETNLGTTSYNPASFGRK